MPIVLITATLLGIALVAAVVTYRTRERFQSTRDRVAAGFRRGLRRLIGRFERVLPWWAAATATTVSLLAAALAITWVIGVVLTAAAQDTGGSFGPARRRPRRSKTRISDGPPSWYRA